MNHLHVDAAGAKLRFDGFIERRLRAPGCEAEREGLAVLFIHALRVLLPAGSCKERLGLRRIVGDLLPRVPVRDARRERLAGCHGVAVGLGEGVVVEHVGERFSKVLVRENAIALVWRDHEDAHACRLVDGIVGLVCEEAAVCLRHALHEVDLARLQRHGARGVVLEELDRDRVKPGLAVPIVLVALHLNLGAFLPFRDGIGTCENGRGGDLRHVRLRVDDDKERVGKRRDQGGVGRFRLDDEAFPVDADFFRVQSLLRAVVFLHRAFERRLDQLGHHRCAVLELYVRADVEAPCRGVDVLPLVGELRHEFHVLVDGDERLARADARQRPAVPGVRGVERLAEPPKGEIEMPRLALHAAPAAACEGQ